MNIQVNDPRNGRFNAVAALSAAVCVFTFEAPTSGRMMADPGAAAVDTKVVEFLKK